jgi:hypothetical protein
VHELLGKGTWLELVSERVEDRVPARFLDFVKPVDDLEDLFKLAMANSVWGRVEVHGRVAVVHLHFNLPANCNMAACIGFDIE